MARSKQLLGGARRSLARITACFEQCVAVPHFKLEPTRELARDSAQLRALGVERCGLAALRLERMFTRTQLSLKACRCDLASGASTRGKALPRRKGSQQPLCCRMRHHSAEAPARTPRGSLALSSRQQNVELVLHLAAQLVELRGVTAARTLAEAKHLVVISLKRTNFRAERLLRDERAEDLTHDERATGRARGCGVQKGP
ncbi:hypothetical protein AB1Y20_021730 [Prymnesium parvum]|uniref:Uncharacterized protein n=1 Tax=Prymnesium parvum TaxID=97485 RepID=A0AB34JLG3_PRYPA